MFNSKLYIGLACFLLAGAYSCKREINQPLPGEYPAPAPVSKVEVVNIKGGAQLTYMLPQDGSVRYVEAVWSYNDVERSVKASAFTDTLLLEGFGDTLSHEIKVYSVNAGQQRSAPVTVVIHPLTPSIVDIFRSISVVPYWGGVKVELTNEMKKPVTINILATDSITGKLKNTDAYMTNLETEVLVMKGYKAVEQQFGFFVSDEWGNSSDTLYTTLTPLEEIELDKSKFRLIDLPGDLNGRYYSDAIVYSSPRIWDNNIATFMHSAVNTPFPQSITIDLGEVVTLGRFRIWPRMDVLNALYAGGDFKIFEIWGSEDEPDESGSWDNWIKLRDCEVIKPSGLPLGQLSGADIEAANAGHEFLILATESRIRYIRLKVLQTWGGQVQHLFI